MAEDRISIERALDTLKASTISQVRTLVTAVVDSYDGTTHRAICQVARRDVTRDGQVYGPAVTPPLPVRPVWRGNGVTVRGELKKGDLVQIEVTDRMLEDILDKGGVVDPQSQRRFSLADGVVVPLASNKKPMPPADGYFSIERDDGAAWIRITMTAAGEVELEAPSIKLGAGASEAIVKGDAFRALYNAHTHTAPNGGGATTVPVVAMDVVPGTHTSTKVKTE